MVVDAINSRAQMCMRVGVAIAQQIYNFQQQHRSSL